MLGGVAIGGSYEALAAIAERSAGDEGDLFGIKKPLAELVGRKSRVFYRGKGVKRALRLSAGKTEPIEAIYDYLAPVVVFLAHSFNVLVTRS